MVYKTQEFAFYIIIQYLQTTIKYKFKDGQELPYPLL